MVVTVYATDIIYGDICMKRTGKIQILTHTKLRVEWVTGYFPLSVVWNLKI